MASKPWVPFGFGSAKTERKLPLAIARGPQSVCHVPLQDGYALPRRARQLPRQGNRSGPNLDVL
jgi:hypothetical protein